MPAYHARHRVGALIDRNLPWPSTLMGVAILLVLFLAGLAILLGTTPAAPATSTPAPSASVVITPDDPAAPTPIPVQVLER
jgi:hypothetical protein